MSWPSALPSEVILATDAGGHLGTYGVLERLKQGGICLCTARQSPRHTFEHSVPEKGRASVPFTSDRCEGSMAFERVVFLFTVA